VRYLLSPYIKQMHFVFKGLNRNIILNVVHPFGQGAMENAQKSSYAYFRLSLWPGKCHVRVQALPLRGLGCYNALPIEAISRHRGRLYIIVQQWWNADYRRWAEATRRETCSNVTASTMNLIWRRRGWIFVLRSQKPLSSCQSYGRSCSNFYSNNCNNSYRRTYLIVW
jgi:hypothetical protein